MQYQFPRVNKISRDEFLKIREQDLLFITNPGRMGDEDGSTFIINTTDGYKVYRIDGWCFGDRTGPNFISYSEMADKFPDWSSSIGTVEENEDSLYRYVYMGFGNGLSIKKDLYEPFMKHLAFAVDRYAENRNIDRSEKEKNKYAIIFNVWDEAVVNIAADINVDLL